MKTKKNIIMNTAMIILALALFSFVGVYISLAWFGDSHETKSSATLGHAVTIRLQDVATNTYGVKGWEQIYDSTKTKAFPSDTLIGATRIEMGSTTPALIRVKMTAEVWDETNATISFLDTFYSTDSSYTYGTFKSDLNTYLSAGNTLEDKYGEILKDSKDNVAQYNKIAPLWNRYLIETMNSQLQLSKDDWVEVGEWLYYTTIYGDIGNESTLTPGTVDLFDRLVLNPLLTNDVNNWTIKISLTAEAIQAANREDPEFPWHDALQHITFKNDYEREPSEPQQASPASYFITDGAGSITGLTDEGKAATALVVPSSIDDEGISEIGADAFKNNTTLESIVISDSVESIGNYAFRGCTSLESVEFNATTSDVSAMSANNNSGARMKTRSTLSTRAVIPSGTTTIGSSAFTNCTDLTSITIPSSVTSIGSSAFSGCSGLTSVTFGENSQFTSIGSYAFNKCSGLTSITIPSSVTSIGSYAFYNCSGLTSVTFGENSQLTSIGSYAFFNCSGLTSITIPSSVTSIGSWAFYNCSGLTSVTFGENSQLTSIDSSAFYNCSGLTSVTFGENSQLTSIDSSAFYKCSGLTSITIPERVKTIGSQAFEFCSGLTEVVISSSVTSIGWGAFSNCDNLTYNTYDNAKYLGNETNPYVVLMDTISTSITSCTINESCKIIYYRAFFFCSRLTSITIPEGVTTIGNRAFDGCSNLTSIPIPDSVTSIGSWAFSGCSGLTSIKIPSSVTSIDSDAFEGCDNLTYNIYDNAKYLGNETNPYMVLVEATSTDITSCTISDGCKIIYQNAFYGCSGLTSIEIPSSVTSIGEFAFSGCSGLTEIVIPSSVTSIRNCAFGYYNELRTVFYGGTADEWSAISIGSNNTPLTYVTRYDYVENEADVPSDGGNYWHFVDGVPTKW